MLCALLCMVLAPIATQMHLGLHQWSKDTDMFKQKIRLLNEFAKRARTESNVPEERKHVGLLQYRLVSLTTSRVWKVSHIWWQRRLTLSLPIMISLALQRTSFWSHQPRTELLVKEQWLVKLRSSFALQGFHSSVSAATQFELSQSGSCESTAGSIQPGAAGFDWSSMTLSLKGTPCDVCFC